MKMGFHCLKVKNIIAVFKILNLILTFSSVRCEEEETTTLLSFNKEENTQIKSGKIVKKIKHTTREILTQSKSKTIITRSRYTINLILYILKIHSFNLTTYFLICFVNCYVTICMLRILPYENLYTLYTGEGALKIVQLAINTNLGCWKKEKKIHSFKTTFQKAD